MIKKFLSSYFSKLSTVPEWVAPAHLPSLDGARGVAIILVIVDHFSYLTAYQFLHYFFSAPLGVHIFFVLSGFLITTILIKERITKKRISLKLFYLRRFLRIFPVAYLYIVAILVLNAIYKLNYPYQAFLGAALYIQDFGYFHNNVYFSHYWSLSVEEQFYFLFPPMLKINWTTYKVLLPVIFVLLHALDVLCHHNHQLKGSLLQEIINFCLLFDGVIVGSFISVLVFTNCIPMNFINRNKQIINLICLVLIYITHYYGFPVLHHFSSFFIGLFLISNVFPANDFIFKCLNSKILSRIGIFSYSLYIWQQPFTLSHILPAYQDIIWFRFPINIFLLLIVSYISYQYFERFFLRMKARYSPAEEKKAKTNDEMLSSG